MPRNQKTTGALALKCPECGSTPDEDTPFRYVEDVATYFDVEIRDDEVIAQAWTKEPDEDGINERFACGKCQHNFTAEVEITWEG